MEEEGRLVQPVFGFCVVRHGVRWFWERDDDGWMEEVARGKIERSREWRALGWKGKWYAGTEIDGTALCFEG